MSVWGSIYIYILSGDLKDSGLTPSLTTKMAAPWHQFLLLVAIFVSIWVDSDAVHFRQIPAPFLDYLRYEKRHFMKSLAEEIFSNKPPAGEIKYEENMDHIGSSYILVPRALIDVSKAIQEDTNCTAVRPPLHQNHFQSYNALRLRPEWIRNSFMIGECPTRYVRRVLPEQEPREIVEAQCVCENHQCSHYVGYQCQAVTYLMDVWVKDVEQQVGYRRGQQKVTVACVCARHEGRPGNVIHFGEFP